MRRAIPALAAMLLLFSPVAAKAGDDCRTIALLTDPHADLSRLSLQMHRDTKMDLLVSGKGDFLTGASSCDINGEFGSLSIDCEWEAASASAALDHFNFMQGKLGPCLKAEMELAENTYFTDSYRVTRSYAGSVESEAEDDYSAIGVSLEVVEFIFEGGTPSYSVKLEVQR